MVPGEISTFHQQEIKPQNAGYYVCVLVQTCCLHTGMMLFDILVLAVSCGQIQLQPIRDKYPLTHSEDTISDFRIETQCYSYSPNYASKISF